MEEKASQSKQPRVHDLFAWESLSKPTLDYPKGTFLSLGTLILILSAIFVLFQEWLAIAVTWAAYFLFFAITKVPQVMVNHKITTEGIVSMDHSYIWMSLGPFWFTTKKNEMVLHIAQKGFLGHLALLVKPEDKEKIVEILAEYLPYIEVPEKSSLEKAADWFAKKLG